MAARDNGNWPHLPLDAFSDRELLLVFEQAMEDDGGATAVRVAEFTNEGARAAKAIGGRFSWLKRWGFMEQNQRTKKWHLTGAGEELLRGVQLSERQAETVARFVRRGAAIGLGEAMAQAAIPTDLKMIKRTIRYREVNG